MSIASRARTSCTLWVSGLLLAAMIPSSSPAGGVPNDPCIGMVIETESGAELDEGWTWRAHNKIVPEGTATSWAVLKRCSNNQAACHSDNDCGAGTCVATCDCGTDGSCELTGPVHQRKCLNNLADCSTNTDCPASAACVAYFGAPMPVSYDGSPTCVLTHFESDGSGTFDAGTGEISLSATLRRRYFLGSNSDTPCPRCGAPDANPQVGGEFVCEGGQFPGAACIVEGVTPGFGGTSSDCPPTSGANITGPGVVFPLRDLGTDTKTKTAQLPCALFGFTGNPLSPGSNPKCTDDTGGTVCTSNADCRRCTGDPTIKCTNNGACTGNGTCEEAPEQPITCGFWCHCGFCNGVGTSPCFDNSDCSEGQTCQKGAGTAGTATHPQQQPNGCSADSFICGEAGNELCKDTQVGSCSLDPQRACDSDPDCLNFAAGTCVFTDQPCFEPEISRTGSASPLGSYCAFEDKACSTNGDCNFGGDFCVANSTRAEMVALYCLPATSSSALNSVLGFTGPAAASLPTFAKVCRCTGNEPGCADICDSGSGDCGNGMIEAGEDCDGGVCCKDDCTLLDAGTVCRGSAGACDAQETCNGTATSCPSDTFQASTTVCRGSAGVCDVAESCTGTSAGCPVDSFAPTSTGCRAAAGQCDQAESCVGTAPDCPVDSAKEDGTVCDDGNACTVDDCESGVCVGDPMPGCEAECGDGTLDDGEVCDDGNATFSLGEYCGVGCVLIPCGRPTNSTGEDPKTSDALYILRTAVDQVECSPRVCSVDGNQTILSSDALRVLRAAVGQPVTLDCPTS